MSKTKLTSSSISSSIGAGLGGLLVKAKSSNSVEAKAMATSFKTQCTLDKATRQSMAAPPPPSSSSSSYGKRRQALENISTNTAATIAAASGNVSAAAPGATTEPSKESTLKKSRFSRPSLGNASSSSAANAAPVATVKKSESLQNGAKKNAVAAKENLAGKQQAASKQPPPITAAKPSTRLVAARSANIAAPSAARRVAAKQPVAVAVAEASAAVQQMDVQPAAPLGKTITATVSLDYFQHKRVERYENVDAGDADEFNVTDYISDIFHYYRERERQFSVADYLSKQRDLNRPMRQLLVDWMVEVQQQLEFNHEVLYLSVKLLDMFLNNSGPIEKEKLQVLGGAAMFVACKFEERLPPIIDDFIFVSDNAYDRAGLVHMEIDLLKTVKFDIGAPLAYTFLRRYGKCVRADMRFLTLARYVLELSLMDYALVTESESLKACASLYLAFKLALKHEAECAGSVAPPLVSTGTLTATEWNATLTHFADADLDDFIHMVPKMNAIVQAAPASKYKTIYKKYSHTVFYEVAKVNPLSCVELDLLQLKSQHVTSSIYSSSSMA